MIHYVYIDGKICLCELSLFDFGSKFFSKGRHYRAKSLYPPFNWTKQTFYVTKITRVNEDKYEIMFTDPIFTSVSTVFTLVRGYVNYNYDDHTDEDGEIDLKDFMNDMTPVGWYVVNMLSDGYEGEGREYNVIEKIEQL